MTISDWIYLLINLTLIGLVDALSPVRVAIVLLLLNGKWPVLRCTAFILGIFVFTLVFGILIGQSVDSLPKVQVQESPLLHVVGLLLGIGLLIFAIRTWHTVPAPANSKVGPVKLPAFVSRFSDRLLHGNVAMVFVGGMVMQLVSIKSLIIFVAGLKQIIAAPLVFPGNLFALLFLLFIQFSEMIIPVTLFAVNPENSARLLNQMTQWLLHYSYTILAIAEGALAAYLIIDNLMSLLATT